jgi:hypothetical protein
MEQPAEFRDEDHGGFNLRLKTGIVVVEPGLFWLDVYLDGKLMTKMPLRINVTRAEHSQPEQPGRRASKKAKKKP